MATIKREVSPEDEELAVGLIIMAASAYLLDEGGTDYQEIVDGIWPKAVHVHALELGARAVYVLAMQLGVEAEVITTLGAALLADDTTKDN